jgi:hypothetical protein
MGIAGFLRNMTVRDGTLGRREDTRRAAKGNGHPAWIREKMADFGDNSAIWTRPGMGRRYPITCRKN